MVIPLKVLGSVTPGINRDNRTAPTISNASSTIESSKTNTFSASLQDEGTERSFNDQYGSENVSSDVGDFDLSERISFPIRDVRVVFKMEKQMISSYMRQLVSASFLFDKIWNFFLKF